MKKIIKNKKGFVLMETIIVMSILAIGLISLYSYFVIIQKKSVVSKEDVSANLYIAYQIYNYQKKSVTGNNVLEVTRQQAEDGTFYYIYGNVGYSSYYAVQSLEEKNIYNHLRIEKIYYTNYFKNMFTNLNLEGSTLQYLQTLVNKDDINNNYTVLVEIKNEDGSYSFAYYQE